MSNLQDAQRILQELEQPPYKHNELLIAVMKFFGPHFAPDSSVLYMGDATNKFIIYEKEHLEELGVPITMHNKLPSIILFDEAKNLLYLIEAVTSRGLVTPKRHHEWEHLLKDCTAKRNYISAVHDFAEYGRYLRRIAWDTHVWLAKIPEHTIYLNGDKYFALHG